MPLNTVFSLVNQIIITFYMNYMNLGNIEVHSQTKTINVCVTPGSLSSRCPRGIRHQRMIRRNPWKGREGARELGGLGAVQVRAGPWEKRGKEKVDWSFAGPSVVLTVPLQESL